MADDEEQFYDGADQSPVRDDRVLRAVQLDGLVLLKIIKHCKEGVPGVVHGELLGLDVDGVLEVTNSFAVPAHEEPAAQEEFRRSMMRGLDAVNADCNLVGWYRSAFLGSYLTQDTLERMYSYQKRNPAAAFVAYDPFRTKAGKLAVKAYRLSDAFFSLCEKKAFSHGQMARAGVVSAEVLEEIPVKVHNAHLVHGFLYQLREQKEAASVEHERLTLAGHDFLERNLEMLAERIAAYSSEQGTFQYYQRQLARQETAQRGFLAKLDQEDEQRIASGREPRSRADLSRHPVFKPIPQPSRLASVLITRTMEEHCGEMNAVATENLEKLYVVEALRGEQALEQ